VFKYSVRSGAVVHQQFHGYNDFADRVVLDLGCGGGGKTVYYAGRGARHTIGVDFDPRPQTALAYAQQRGLSVEFLSFRAAGRVPLPDDTCDVVINSSVLEHVVDLPATFREVRRVLKPGGLCLSRWHPWRSRYGGHLDALIAVPFAHLIFRERDLVRSFYRLGVQRFGHCPGVCGTFHAHSTSPAVLNFAYNRKSARQMRAIVLAAGVELRARRYLPGPRDLHSALALPARLRAYLIAYPGHNCLSGNPALAPPHTNRARARPIPAPAVPVAEPPLPADLPKRIEAADCVVFTSATGAEIALRDDRLAAPLRRSVLATIGPRTEEALAERGLSASIVPESFSSRGLALALAPRFKRVLLLRSAKGSPELVEILEEAGVEVDEVHLYDIAPSGDPKLDWLILRGTPDVFAFTSGSTARNILARAKELGAEGRLRGRLSEAKVAAIGPPTRAVLEDLGVRVDVMPERYTFRAMLEELRRRG